jgi:hypothetical protein
MRARTFVVIAALVVASFASGCASRRGPADASPREAAPLSAPPGAGASAVVAQVVVRGALDAGSRREVADLAVSLLVDRATPLAAWSELVGGEAPSSLGVLHEPSSRSSWLAEVAVERLQLAFRDVPVRTEPPPPSSFVLVVAPSWRDGRIDPSPLRVAEAFAEATGRRPDAIFVDLVSGDDASRELVGASVFAATSGAAAELAARYVLLSRATGELVDVDAEARQLGIDPQRLEWYAASVVER